MATRMRVKSHPDFEEIERALKINEYDMAALAELIVDGMIERIKAQQTADGEILSENSKWWAGVKLRQGYPTSPLQYKGGLIRHDTYQLTMEGGSMMIQLIPSYREIHLDLIEISETTGKNYKDWFGIAEEDMEVVEAELKRILTTKLVRALG